MNKENKLNIAKTLQENYYLTLKNIVVRIYKKYWLICLLLFFVLFHPMFVSVYPSKRPLLKMNMCLLSSGYISRSNWRNHGSYKYDGKLRAVQYFFHTCLTKVLATAADPGSLAPMWSGGGTERGWPATRWSRRRRRRREGRTGRLIVSQTSLGLWTGCFGAPFLNHPLVSWP